MKEERIKELFNRDDSLLKICVGSWKAYNECNDHALGSYACGSFFIDFMKLESAEELDELLTAIGWSEEEKDELFIQDYESAIFHFTNCDYISPADVIASLAGHQDEIEANEEKVEAMIEYDSAYEDIDRLLEDLEDFDFYADTTAEEYEERLFYDSIDRETARVLDDWLSCYISIDFEAMARDDDAICCETAHGLLVRY